MISRLDKSDKLRDRAESYNCAQYRILGMPNKLFLSGYMPDYCFEQVVNGCKSMHICVYSIMTCLLSLEDVCYNGNSFEIGMSYGRNHEYTCLGRLTPCMSHGEKSQFACRRP